MRQIILVDYISYTNKEGTPVGHPLKVLQEYGGWVSDDFDIIYSAHSSYLRELAGKNKIALPYNICEGEDYFSFKGKLHQFIISWINLSKVWKDRNFNYIWFCNIDFFIFVFLLCHAYKRKKVIITSYLEKFERKYQNIFAQLVLPKIKLLITSNKAIKYEGNNQLYIPDYLYNSSLYEKYGNMGKIEKVVCVGTMGDSKELEELVNVFNKNGYRLEIKGHFSDKNLFVKIKSMAKRNIEIEDCYLQYNNYLELIGESRYCILPYKKAVYSIKTSGVLLESIFVNTIPICNNELLQKWEIAGVGYSKIGELETGLWQRVDCTGIICENNKRIEEKYNKDIYINKIKEILSGADV